MTIKKERETNLLLIQVLEEDQSVPLSIDNPFLLLLNIFLLMIIHYLSKNVKHNKKYYKCLINANSFLKKVDPLLLDKRF